MMDSDPGIVSQMPCWHAKWNVAAVQVAILDVTVLAAKACLPDGRQHDATAPDDLLVGCMLEGTMFPHACAQALANAVLAVDAGTGQTVDEGDTVMLSGTADDAYTGDTLAYSWDQSNPASPTVQITNPVPAAAISAALGVPVDIIFTFTMTINDGTVDAADTMSDDRTRAACSQEGDDGRQVQGGAGVVGAGGRQVILGEACKVRGVG